MSLLPALTQGSKLSPGSMQKLVFLVGLLGVAATGSLGGVVREYSAADCSEGDLKKEEYFTTDGLLAVVKQGKAIPCIRKAEFHCKSGILNIKNHQADPCEGSVNWGANWAGELNCIKADEKQEVWMTLECDKDMAGYAPNQYSWFSSENCSGEPASVVGKAVKYGSCMPDAKMKDGSWVARSSKTTKSSDIITVEEFPTMDCSGSPSSVEKETCGACAVDGKRGISVTCGSVVADADDEASGAIEPSCIFPALLILAVAAKQG